MFRLPEVAARAGAHGGDEQERGWSWGRFRPWLPVVLQRFAQGTETAQPEGREIFQEEHAALRQVHLPRLLPTGEGDGPDGWMHG